MYFQDHRIQGTQIVDDLFHIALDHHFDKAGLYPDAEDIQMAEQRTVDLFGKRQLDGMHIALHALDISTGDHVALIEDAEGIADILQLADVVAGDDHGHLIFLHALGKRTLEHQPHHRIQAVKDLIQKQQPGADGQGEDDERLTLHAFGELGHRPFLIQSELFQIMRIGILVE